MVGIVETYLDRVRGVITARLGSPRARRGTRYWKADSKAAPAANVEVKAVDPAYIVPDSLIGEIVEAGRPIAFTVVTDTAADTADRIGGGNDLEGTEGMFEIDQDLLDDLIDEALEDLLGDAERYAADLRRTIADGDTDGVELDDLLDRVGAALDEGGNWLRLSARTIGTALAGKTALEQARALGVTHAQWISRRDPRVRPTHRAADGQVRPIGEAFRVGAHQLDYPGDPAGLPATAEEVHGCRCGLLFADRDDSVLDDLAAIGAAAIDPGDPVTRLLELAAASTTYSAGASMAELPGLASVVDVPAPVVGWRLLDAPLAADPGQRLELPEGTALGLVGPDDPDPLALAVLIPAGTAVGVSGGALVLEQATTVQVLAVGAAGTQGRIAET